MSATTGKQITVVADPQPGTTNTPFPSDKQPAFTPVGFEIADDHFSQIIAQTTQLTARNERLISAQNQMSNAFNSLADKGQANLKLIKDIDIALSGLATSLTMTQYLLSTVITSNIKKNDIVQGSFNDTLEYGKEVKKINSQLPSSEAQFGEAVADGQVLVKVAAAENTIQVSLTSAAYSIVAWITESSVWTSIKKYFSDIFDTVVTNIIPSSWRSKANNVKAISGDPTIGP